MVFIICTALAMFSICSLAITFIGIATHKIHV
jgi:hypothetical protein